MLSFVTKRKTNLKNKQIPLIHTIKSLLHKNTICQIKTAQKYDTYMQFYEI